MKIAKKVIVDNSVIITFSNGHVLTCDLSDVSKEILMRLAVHGASQKVGDSYASAESIEQAIASATEVWGNLEAGVWATRATGGKLAEALAKATGQDISACIAKLAEMPDDEKKALKKHPGIKQAMAEIDLERAKAAAKAPAEGGANLGELFTKG